MNSEEFIKKHLTEAVRSDHSFAIASAKKIINKAVIAYRENSFIDLQELIKDSEEKIKSVTWMIGELSRGGGTTAKMFAESQQISVATARKRLNSSLLSIKNCDKKPYIYTLTNEI